MSLTTDVPRSPLAPELLAARNAVAASFVLNGLVFATLVSRLPDLRERLSLSNGAHWGVVRAMRELAPRLVVTGGGGYNPYTVGRCWAGVWAVRVHDVGSSRDALSAWEALEEGGPRG